MVGIIIPVSFLYGLVEMCFPVSSSSSIISSTTTTIITDGTDGGCNLEAKIPSRTGSDRDVTVGVCCCFYIVTDCGTVGGCFGFLFENKTLEKIAEVLKIPVKAIKNYSEEATVNFITNTFHDTVSTINNGNRSGAYYYTFNPIDKII